MNRRQIAWFMVMATLALLVAASAPALPVQEGDVPASGAEVEPGQADASRNAVETILKEQEELLRGQRFSYDPGGRRDPFRSLYETMKPQPGSRPRGVAGMLVAEIDLAGIVKSGEGDMAFFTGSDSKGYFLRVGDQIYDGTLIAIDTRSGSVTFRQQVDDPRQIKPYRDVVKTLVSLDEEESVNE